MTAATDLADGVQAVLDAVAGVVIAPGDVIRVLVNLAGLPGTGPAATLCRRLTVIALAEAAANYQPTSYDDAQATIGSVSDALDAEITAAGDAEDDATFVALQALRAAVVADLTARGASLAPLVTVTLEENLPALVVADRLYRDASREADLVQRVDPIHPLFLPTTIQVLGS